MGTNIVCPNCHAEIPLEDVNVTTDIALCRRCGQTSSYAELINDSRLPAFDSRNPPGGAWFQEMPPRGFTVGVTTRSFIALFLVPFMCVW
jgi:hypothetical protein